MSSLNPNTVGILANEANSMAGYTEAQIAGGLESLNLSLAFNPRNEGGNMDPNA
jgi:hypothetical protein